MFFISLLNTFKIYYNIKKFKCYNKARLIYLNNIKEEL